MGNEMYQGAEMERGKGCPVLSIVDQHAQGSSLVRPCSTPGIDPDWFGRRVDIPNTGPRCLPKVCVTFRLANLVLTIARPPPGVIPL